uniref:WAP domain-containing protein n=1 Tax=Neolamprologus brichardi TaxID=32507 RepID=A0A3Q4G1G8_NEOBR
CLVCFIKQPNWQSHSIRTLISFTTLPQLIYVLFCFSFFVCTNLFFLSAKPGECPRTRWDFGLCEESCFNDYECPDNEKCCFTGCGHQCMARTLSIGLHMCDEYYYHDGQDPGHQTCCRTTCDYTCSELCCQSIKKHH